jgi:hypothetical protein
MGLLDALADMGSASESVGLMEKYRSRFARCTPFIDFRNASQNAMAVRQEAPRAARLRTDSTERSLNSPSVKFSMMLRFLSYRIKLPLPSIFMLLAIRLWTSMLP